MAAHTMTMLTSSSILILLMTSCVIVTWAQPDMTTVYVGPHLSHLVLDNETGILYAAGVNRLYQMDSDLDLLSEAVTGPKQDSIDCLPPPHDECSTGRKSTDNYNKILLLDRAQRMLITCGSVYQGACETRSLTNISDLQKYYGADDVTDFAVASNSQNASTVAFIAPGPATHSHDVLYVAATYTGRSRTSRIYRDQVPAVSSRSLKSRGRFSLAAVSNPLRGMSSSIYLKSEISSYFLIRYVTGFSYRGFSYFLAVQNDSVEDRADNKKVSKIVQICQDDSNFFSYADVPITCTKDGVDYNVLEAAQIISPGLRLRESLGYVDGFTDEILVAAFSRTDERWDSVDSAVCMYTMQDIRATFLENIKLCHQGNSSVSGGGYLRVGPRGNCNQPSGLVIHNIEDDHQYLCNTNLESFSNVVGIVPIARRPVLEFVGQHVTAINVTQVHEHTVAFLGTSFGRLKKVVLSSSTRAREYSEMVVEDGSAILPDLVLDPRQENIYVMTRTNISRVAVENCRQHTTCSDCLNDGDPYCGWCSLEKRCTLKGLCPNSDNPTEGRWLHGSSNQCIYITTISPTTASVTEVADLHLTIPQLPVRSNYSCVFLDLKWSSPADIWYFGARCSTPNFKDLGLSLGLEGYRTVTLALNSTETGKLFVTKNFTFYNCSNFKTCTQCTDSAFDCHWCVYDNGCYHDTMSCQSNIIAGRSSTKPGRKGAMHCPRIDTVQTGNIYLPVGVPRMVLLKGYNFPQLKSNLQGYRCIVNTGSTVFEATAELLDDTLITCNMPEMYYSDNQGMLAADLSVYWGNDFFLESSKGLVALLYKCEVLANEECSLCVNLNYTRSYLECFWCDGRCTYLNRCDQKVTASCPAPQILSVWPLSGPIQGGTNVTIEGRNLGSKFEDIENTVYIAGVRCIPFSSLYLPSRRIVCQTRWKGQIYSGPVEIRQESGVNVKSTDIFHYRSPLILDIHPRNGPMSGGSRVTIMGQDLNTGGQLRALMGDAPCIVDRNSLTPESVVCETTRVWQAEHKSPIQVFFDGAKITLNQDFVYRDDPVITKIHPLASIREGGRMLTIMGTNLGYIQQPQMFAYVPMEGGEFYPTESTDCKVINTEEIHCPSPPLDPDENPTSTIIRSRRRRRTAMETITDVIHKLQASQKIPGHSLLGSLSARAVRVQRSAESKERKTRTSMKRVKRVEPVSEAQLGFIMDGVLSVRNLTGVDGLDALLKYYPNPRVYNFSEPDSVKVFKGEMLIIEGMDLTLAAEKQDVHVWVGSEVCNVTLLSPSQIACEPPPSQPAGVDIHGNPDSKVKPLVVVKVNNMKYQVGRVEYDVPETFSFPMEAIAGIAAGGGFLLLIIILILIIYRRQSTRAERIYHKLQIQLDNLESNVRNECKQAFAELQTDMTDLTGDLVSSGIPFWDYHTYTFKVLFPGLTNHVILHPPLQKNGQFRFSDQGLQMFHQLLNKKIFMLTFIRTLEAQRSFSIRDRANVASLLMIVYQNNMEYLTDILKALLIDLVQKSVAGRHPKLMLRRSESVVEKLLTNWLSLCLYKHLKDHAGSSLFMLYKAIKLQVEKGPVDFVTGDARYSLSEDRLLREKIEPKSLMLNVEHGVEVVQCRVLDCDTITQVKEKILDHLFKNIPFSQRPCMEDLELEWRNGPTGPLTLSDEDIASYNRDGWRRLNTLAYYKVHDGAYMSLLHRQHTYKTLNGTLDHALMMSMASQYPMKRDSDNTRVWHLVKHDDVQVKDGGVKMISEIFLTRLLSTKGTLQKYIDDLFKIVLAAGNVPPIVKFLFDFLDHEAVQYGITDPEVVHTWKCNSLPLRFWVNIIKNPDFVFDINKPLIVDSCLSVVGQTFMDSCSTTEHRLGKDSPSNKLLFAKDIVHYRKLVEKYFADIRDMPPISDQDISTYLADVSRMCSGKFYISSALRELYSFASKHSNELLEDLEQDNQANAQQMSAKLGHVITAMEGPSARMAYV